MIKLERPACILVSEKDRADFAHSIFGLAFPLRVEPTVYHFANLLSQDYQGGLWEFAQISNGAFLMYPASSKALRVQSPNGFEGRMDAVAFGVTCCLFALSHLSYGEDAHAQTYSEHYHWLREYAFELQQGRAIAAATD